jgi:hypothetical protein
MKKISKILLILTILIFSLSFILCNPEEPANDTVAAKAIFDLPSTMTGDTTAGAALQVNRSITPTPETKQNIDSYFNLARTQIRMGKDLANTVKGWISAIEDAGFFDLTTNYEGVLEGENAGDKIKWTVGNGTDFEYRLEWWKDNSPNFDKFLEITFYEYTNLEGAITVEGEVVANLNADTSIDAANTYWDLPELVRIEFDSDKDGNGTQYMRIELDEFIYTYDTDVFDPADKQELILIAEKDANGIVTITGVNSGNGSKVLNYDGDPSDYGQIEERYYIYVGKGDSDTATLSLAMPKDTYTPSTVFTTAEHTIGGVIKEYVADELRYDTSDGGNYSNSIFYWLDYIETNPPVSDTNYFAGDYSSGNIDFDLIGTSESPSTNDIYNDLIKAYDAGYGTTEQREEFAQVIYKMGVANPAYFISGGYDSFGSTAPSGYPTASELPDFTIDETTINDLTINFLDATNLTNPGF